MNVIFHWNGGIYRGISAQAAELYEELLRQKEVSRLFAVGLAETEIVPLELDGYEFVVKHHKIPFVSYFFEWCGTMLRDAALLTLNLTIELAPFGLELQDGHPRNVMFDGYKPVFIDFSSIRPIKDRKSWYPINHFILKFLNPLYLISKGYSSQARTIMADYLRFSPHGIKNQDIATLLNWEKRSNGT